MISILKHRVVPAALMSLMVIFLSSCGYHMGSMMHPQIKTVERFQFDNSLKITTPEKADCIVMCRILSVKNAGVVWKSTDEDMTFRPSEFSITVNAEFTVTIPGSAKPLVSLRKVTGSATYQFTADPAIGRENGLIQACYNMANLVVQYTTEAW